MNHQTFSYLLSKPDRKLVLLLTISTLALSLSMCSPLTTEPSATGLTPTPVSMSQSVPGSISANGVLLPKRQVKLSFGVGGLTESVQVGLGESVQAGQTLVQLDTTEAQMAVKQAEEELAIAQENYALVEANLPEEQQAAVAAAALELMAAQQALEALYENTTTARATAFNEIAAANEAVGEAKYQLYYFTMPSTLSGLDPLKALDLAKEKAASIKHKTINRLDKYLIELIKDINLSFEAFAMLRPHRIKKR